MAGQIDETDERLLARLRDDARASVTELARALGLSRTTVQSRIERLERSGVIAGYTVRTGDAYADAQIHAYVLIVAVPKQAAQVAAAARRMPAVRRLRSVSGPFDLIAEVAAPTVSAMDTVIDALGALDGVERTTSSLVLSTKFDR